MEAILLDRLGTRIKVGTEKAGVEYLLRKRANEKNGLLEMVGDVPNQRSSSKIQLSNHAIINHCFLRISKLVHS